MLRTITLNFILSKTEFLTALGSKILKSKIVIIKSTLIGLETSDWVEIMPVNNQFQAKKKENIPRRVKVIHHNA